MIKKNFIALLIITLPCISAEKKIEHVISEGPYFGQTVQVLTVESISTKHKKDPKVLDILSRRVAKLPKIEQVALNSALEGKKTFKEIFNSLPEKVKTGTISLCLIEQEQRYIDSQYLKQKDTD